MGRVHKKRDAQQDFPMDCAPGQSVGMWGLFRFSISGTSGLDPTNFSTGESRRSCSFCPSVGCSLDGWDHRGQKIDGLWAVMSRGTG